MPLHPTVDVNLFVYNGAETIRPAIESVLAQTWPQVSLTLIDDCSTDGTAAVLHDYVARYPSIRLKHNRSNGGAIPNFQRSFWSGDADFVMPKSGDDLLEPEFVATIMALMRTHPTCAMCHAAGVVFTGDRAFQYAYPAEHRLHAIGADPSARARDVMQRYTTSPSFWGIYRRAAVDRLAPIRYRAGWDHALLAELALHGEIRHVSEPLYWRRDGGKPVLHLARASTVQGCRGIPLDGVLAEQRWRTPLITTAYAHLETFATVRLPEAERLALMRDAAAIFRARWLPEMRQEATILRRALPPLIEALQNCDPLVAHWIRRELGDVTGAVEAILPDEDFTLSHLELAALAGETRQQPKAA